MQHIRTCPLCEATCGLKITLDDDGSVTRVEGDKDDVFSRGFICPKGAAIGALHADPDRLRTPLVRAEDGTLQEASWEEAFAAVERGLMPILKNSAAVGVFLGNPNVHNLAGSLYVKPLLKALRTRNIFTASTVDQIPKHVSSGLMFGSAGTIPVPDIDRTDYMLMLGANPWASNGSLCTAPDFPGRLKGLQARGGRFVVVDPRRTRTARYADEHLFIRPGTDPWFLVALLNVLFKEGRVDVGALAPHIHGVEAVEQAVEAVSPERAEAMCGIAADVVRRIARELSEASSAVVYGRIGTQAVAFGTLASWAVDAINVVTGNFDRPGGAMFPKAAHHRRKHQAGGRGFRLGRWTSRVRGLPEAMGELPCATLVDEIETEGEGQIRALITIAGNPVLSTPEGPRLDKALGGLDFMVSIDPYLNATTRHADVILPSPSPLERSHYDLAFYGLSVRDIANYSPPTLPTENPDESEIVARLALIASGQGAGADPKIVDQIMLMTLAGREVGSKDSAVFGREPGEVIAEIDPSLPGPEKVLDFLLRTGPYGDGFGAEPDGLTLAKLQASPHGIDLGALKPQIPAILSTPSGLIELLPAPILEELQRLEQEKPHEGGLVLIGRRHLRSNNSWMHNIETLVRGKNRCTLMMHPADAKQHGLEDGHRAEVRSRVGAVEVDVELSDTLMQGVVSLPHGWGHGVAGTRMAVAAAHRGVNSNTLSDGQPLDRLSGNAVLNGIPVEVRALG